MESYVFCLDGKQLCEIQESLVQSLGQKDALEKGTATHVLKSALNEHFCHLCNSRVERDNRQSGRLKHGKNSYSDPFQGSIGGRERKDSRSSDEKGNS